MVCTCGWSAAWCGRTSAARSTSLGHAGRSSAMVWTCGWSAAWCGRTNAARSASLGHAGRRSAMVWTCVWSAACCGYKGAATALWQPQKLQTVAASRAPPSGTGHLPRCPTALGLAHQPQQLRCWRSLRSLWHANADLPPCSPTFCWWSAVKPGMRKSPRSGSALLR